MRTQVAEYEMGKVPVVNLATSSSRRLVKRSSSRSIALQTGLSAIAVRVAGATNTNRVSAGRKVLIAYLLAARLRPLSDRSIAA